MFDVISSAALFGLGAAACWGFGDLLVGKVARMFGGTQGGLTVNSLEAVIYVVIFMLFLRTDAAFSMEGFWYALVGSIAFGCAQATFYKSMKLGPIGLVSAVSSVYPLIALVASVVLFGAFVSGVQIAGVILVVTGVMFASGLTDRANRLGKGPILALLPAFGWGIGAGFIIHAVSLMGWQSTFLVELLTAPLVLLALAPFIRGKEKIRLQDIRKAVTMPMVIGAAVLEMSGLLLLNIGLSANPDAGPVVVAVSSCYPVLVIFLALRHLKERIPIVPLIGGVVGVTGVVVLSLG